MAIHPARRNPACCTACADEAELRERWGADYDDYWARVCAAVAATDGQYLVWEDAPALAVFHASSYRRTEAAADLGMAQPYLASVDSPETAEEVRNLNTTVEVSADDFRAAVLAAVPDSDSASTEQTSSPATAMIMRKSWRITIPAPNSSWQCWNGEK